MSPSDVQATAALPLHRACVGARRSTAQVVPSVVRTRSRTWVVRPRRDAQPLDDVDAEQHWVAARFCGRVHSSVVGVADCRSAGLQIRVCPLHGPAHTHAGRPHSRPRAAARKELTPWIAGCRVLASSNARPANKGGCGARTVATDFRTGVQTLCGARSIARRSLLRSEQVWCQARRRSQ